MKNKERINLMLERLDRLNRILDEKLESSCKEGKYCIEEDSDDLENMDEGVIDSIKGLFGNSGKDLEAQSKKLADDIMTRLGSVTLSNGKSKALKDLIEVNPRKENILRLQGMGCTINAKNKDDDKYTAYIYTPKNKRSYIFISDKSNNKNTFVQKVDLNKPAEIAAYIRNNLSNFTNIKTK